MIEKLINSLFLNLLQSGRVTDTTANCEEPSLNEPPSQRSGEVNDVVEPECTDVRMCDGLSECASFTEESGGMTAHREKACEVKLLIYSIHHTF